MRTLPPWVAWVVFALAWFVRVHEEGVALPEGVPGWEAFRIAAAAVWPYERVEYETWWDAALATLSAATNFLMLGSLWIEKRGDRLRGRTAAAALVAFGINAQWLFWRTEWADLRAGYYLWWLSFVFVSIALRQRAGSGSSPERAGDR